MIGFRSYRTKLQAAFVGLAVLAIVATGWEAGFGAASALRTATFERLTVIRQTRTRQIERYFEDVNSHVLALAADASSVAALAELERAWSGLVPPAGAAAAVRRRFPQYEAWLPMDSRAVALQHAFFVAGGAPGGLYGDAYTRFHPTLLRYQRAFGFYDIFLINPEGRILYTVRKEIDLGADLRQPPYRDTSLARAFAQGMAFAEPERAALEDYAPYAPSRSAPAAFVATPVWREGRKAGVLAIQISIDEVNRVMTGNGHWREEGFGETGQAYMVNAQNALRSGLRVGTQPGEPVERSGTAISADGRRLRSWAPLRVPGVAWSLVAEIDTAEALAPIPELQKRIAVYGLALAAGFFFLARWLGQGITAPLLALAANARRLGGGDFRARLTINRGDEIGELAHSLNRMAEDLEQTTISKQAVDDILASMLNAVFVAVDGRITRVNPAAAELLGYEPEELAGRPFSPANVRPGGTAVETELERKDGSRVPVLLTAARLEAENAVVYAAQDMSERRRLAGQLIAAQEEERRRIARELHDDFSQRLAAAAIAAGQGQQETVRERIGELASELHTLSRRLHPAMLEDLGLEAAIAAECRASFERGGPPVDFTVDGPLPETNAEVNLTLYRVVQESLRNVARHANAQQVTVRLGPYAIAIADDGDGFDPAAHAPGLGLASMEERVRLLGGSWSLSSAPGQGTRIEVRMQP